MLEANDNLENLCLLFCFNIHMYFVTTTTCSSSTSRIIVMLAVVAAILT